MIRRLTGAARNAWGATMKWAGKHPAMSWYIHGTVCYLVAGALAWLGSLTPWARAPLWALCAGALGMALYFLRKELGDWKKHDPDLVMGGVTKRADGWGDLAGPVYFLAGVLSAVFWL